MKNKKLSKDIVKILKADRDDLKLILALQYLAYQSEAVLLNNLLIPPLTQTLEDVNQEYESGIFLKALDCMGTLIGSVRAYTRDGTAHIGKLIVHPEFQGRGIGTQLLNAIERNCSAIRYELFTSQLSARNLKLYETLGYKRFQERVVAPELVFIYLEKYPA